jgi:CheY-like chemotaxis protein
MVSIAGSVRRIRRFVIASAGEAERQRVARAERPVRMAPSRPAVGFGTPPPPPPASGRVGHVRSAADAALHWTFTAAIRRCGTAPAILSMIDATDILSARILVVDDDPDAANMLSQVLTLNGYSGVATTIEPRVVRDLHRANEYDLILLDLHMPSMDGFAVMEGLREFERDGYLPVLAITGEPGHRMRALKLGARDFLRKPVDVDELLLRVRNMIEVRLLYKERMPAA